MAAVIPLYIGAGTITRTGSGDDCAVNSVVPQSATALSLGASTATSVIVGDMTFDLAAGFDLTSPSTLKLGAGSVVQVAGDYTFDGSGDIDLIAAGAANLANATATSVNVGGGVTTSNIIIGSAVTSGTIALGSGITNGKVQLDDVKVTGAVIDKNTAGTLDIAASTATLLRLGHATTCDVQVLGDLQVDGGTTVALTSAFNGDTDIGDASTDTLTITASIDEPVNFEGSTEAAQYFSTTSGDLKFIPEGTAIAQGGLGTALTVGTSYATSNPGGVGTLTGIGTAFNTELEVGDAIEVLLAGGTEVHTVAAITSALILETDAVFVSVESGVTLGLNTDDNLFEVYSGDAQGRLSMDKNGALTVTAGATIAPVLTLATDENSLNAQFFVYSATPEAVITGNQGDLCLTTANGGTLYFCDTDASTSWTAVGAATGNSLQEAYVVGAGISVTAGEGDLAFTLTSADNTIELTGGDVIIKKAANNYLVTDYANTDLDLGSANVQVGFTGQVYTDIAFDGTDQKLTNAGTMGVTTTGANLLSITGGGGITNTSTAGTYTVEAAGQTVDINATTLDVDTTGAIQLDADLGSNFTTSVGDIDISAAAELDLDGGSSVAMNSVTTMALTSGGDFTLDTNGAGDTITVTATAAGAVDAITLATVTTGGIAINSVDDVDIDGADGVAIDSSAGAVSINGAATSDFTTSSGDIDISAAAELDLDGGSSVAMNSVTTMALTSGGTLALATNGAGDTISLTATSVGAAADGILLSTVTTGDISISSTDILDLDGADGVTIDSAGAAVSIDAAATSNFTTSSGNIVVSAAAVLDLDGGSTVAMNSVTTTTITGGSGLNLATTAGEIDILAAGALDMGAAAGHVTIDCAAAYDIALTAADNAGSDITFQAHASAVIEFNGATAGDTGNKDLASTFTATSIIGALNELKADSGEFTISRTVGLGGVTAGNGVYIKSADGDVLKSDADASAETARLVGFARTTAAEDATVLVDTMGEVTVSSDLSGDLPGEYVYASATAGAVTTTAPGAGTVLRVGIITDIGTGPGDGKILIQVGTPINL